MVRYLAMITFTEQGIKNVKGSIVRAKSFVDAVEAAGGKVDSEYWAVGEADGVVIFEAPNENAAASLLLKLGQAGNVRTRTMRIYNADEFEKIVKAS